MKFPRLTEDFRLARLAPPTGKVRMVLDTDTFNEIDDQFAVVYSLLSPESVQVEAIYAAPFHNARSSGPADGMEKSYQEILRLLERLERSPKNFVYRGAAAYLPQELKPVESAAASDLVQRAAASCADDPLYVVAIGAATNVASALLLEPTIVEKIVVVWLGGHALHWPHTREFNLSQDLAASRLLFDSGVPLVHVPCMGVTSHLHTTVPEIEAHVRGRGKIGDYLADIFKQYHDDHLGWSKALWDLAAVAYLVDPGLVPSNFVHSPILTDQLTWSFDASRPLIRSVYYVHRDGIFRDFFRKLDQHALREDKGMQ